MNTSISIDKILTVIEYVTERTSLVSMHKMSCFESIISRHKNITLSGYAKPAKKEKYHKLMIENGFSVSKTNHCQNVGFEGRHSDVLSYSIEYTKK